MSKINLPLTIEGKGSKNKHSNRGKTMFGYQVLGFGGGETPLEPTTVEYLIIAGGGSGGHNGGGGGAGGYRANVSGEASGGQTSAEPAKTLDPDTDYAVTIGAASNNSVFDGITSLKGGATGGGGGQPGQGGNGQFGSGGGQGGTGQGGHSPSNAAGTTGQGMPGGSGTQGSDQAGAGGGASGQGANAHGPGGAGVNSDITGSTVGRGGGGGNAPNQGYGGGYAGNGPGVANTGGGGMVAPGGSGVVIIKYPDAYTLTASAGLTTSTGTSGDFKVTSITAGTGTFQLG